MCELMGLSFARPISADFSIHAFAPRSDENADGWGLAWYPDRSLALVKEPVQWETSTYTRFLESYPRLLASIYIAHIRHRTTGGPPTHADTHPFRRELAGRDYCFAHNGTLLGFLELPLGRYHPVGATDSERVFCYLLEEVAQRVGHLDDAGGWDWLHGRLAELNRGGKLNCVLSDGRRLFCYHDAAAYKGLAFRPVRMHDHERRRFEDPVLHVSLDGSAEVNHGFVVATCPLSNSGWHSFQAGELIVLEEGRVAFSSHRRVDDAVFAGRKGDRQPQKRHR
jgi:glutamine amidotransferase